MTNEEDAIAFFRELDNEFVVVKPARGAGSQGVYMCCGEEEMLEGVRRHFKQCIDHGNEPSVLIQERIDGEEYVVNTVSCNGEHRVVTVGKYDTFIIGTAGQGAESQIIMTVSYYTVNILSVK